MTFGGHWEPSIKRGHPWSRNGHPQKSGPKLLTNLREKFSLRGPQRFLVKAWGSSPVVCGCMLICRFGTFAARFLMLFFKGNCWLSLCWFAFSKFFDFTLLSLQQRICKCQNPKSFKWMCQCKFPSFILILGIGKIWHHKTLGLNYSIVKLTSWAPHS